MKSKVKSILVEEAKNSKLFEAISNETDLLLKLRALPESDIFQFMKDLRGGTYFNMGMYSSIPVAAAYKKTIRIYKVIDLAAIVSGVDYENIKTTKDYRVKTGDAPGHAWYNHVPGFEDKVAVSKKNPNAHYVLWDIKKGTNTCVRYYVVDIATGSVQAVTKDSVLNSNYLTASEKKKLTPQPVVGFDLNTGALVANETNWRTAAFEHVFWLSQNGANTHEYGTRFVEALELKEEVAELFRDGAVAGALDLDKVLAGQVKEELNEDINYFSGDYQPNFEPDEYERVEEIRQHINDGDLDYLYTEFDFADNETIEDAYFDENDQLHIIYNEESLDEGLNEDVADIFMDKNANEADLDSVLADSIKEEKDPRYSELVDNDLFVDFD